MNERLTRVSSRPAVAGRAAGRIAAPLWNSLLVGALGSLVLFSACKSTKSMPPLPTLEPIAPTPASSTRLPQWVGEPMSKAKLESIETWLASEGSSADPFWRVEGELTLNRGRVDLARGDGPPRSDTSGAAAAGGAKGASGARPLDNASRGRVKTARAGFARVVGESDATAGQKKRAQAGIALCDRLLGAPSNVANAAPSSTLSVIGRAKWGAVPANSRHMDKNRGGWKRITVHHSAERYPPELDGSLSESAAAVRSIQQAHMEGKETGYGDIGYHFVIDPYGRVFQGRDLVWQGAHAAGDNNVQNIGVCLIGNFDDQRPTKAALDGLRRMLDSLRSTWKIPRSAVLTHQELKSTECPGKNLARWVESYRRGGGAATPVAAAVRAR